MTREMIKTNSEICMYYKSKLFDINIPEDVRDVKLMMKKKWIDYDEIKKELEIVYNACNDERVFEIQTRLSHLLKLISDEK